VRTDGKSKTKCASRPAPGTEYQMHMQTRGRGGTDGDELSRLDLELDRRLEVSRSALVSCAGVTAHAAPRPGGRSRRGRTPGAGDTRVVTFVTSRPGHCHPIRSNSRYHAHFDALLSARSSVSHRCGARTRILLNGCHSQQCRVATPLDCLPTPGPQAIAGWCRQIRARPRCACARTMGRSRSPP
jgi:hypothetical protein